jgi:hypothetical protein
MIAVASVLTGFVLAQLFGTVAPPRPFVHEGPIAGSMPLSPFAPPAGAPGS